MPQHNKQYCNSFRIIDPLDSFAVVHDNSLTAKYPFRDLSYDSFPALSLCHILCSFLHLRHGVRRSASIADRSNRLNVIDVVANIADILQVDMMLLAYPFDRCSLIPTSGFQDVQL